MNEMKAREQILQAAARLTEEGLIERTWGNISARVSETQFLITPSGLAYDTLRPEQLVLVDIADGSYAGNIKPSSEKGIHADAYRLRPEAAFVIHTHQTWASIAGVEGRALTGFIHPTLGKRVPCAGYGLPGTGQLRRAAASEVEAWPDCQAFLLRRHGALCLGRDMEDAFAAVRALEEVCEARVRGAVDGRLDVPVPQDCGSSERRGDAFLLTLDGERKSYHIGDSYLPPAAALHAAVYRTGNFQYAVHEASPEVVAASGGGPLLRPYLDDLAQIAGADLRCVPARARFVELALAGRNAVLLKGAGALCAAGVESDVAAVRSLLRKGCMARLYAQELPDCRPLGAADAQLQRLVYLQSYKGEKPMLKKLSEEKLEELLEIGVEEFACRGLAGASVRAITDRAGISVGALYKYYGDKDGFFRACLDRSLKTLDQVLAEAAGEAADFREYARRIIRSLLRFSREHGGYVRMYCTIAASGGEEARRLAGEIEGVTARLYSRTIAAGQAGGELRQDMDPAMCAFFFDSLLMMVQFAGCCDYYRERFRLYGGGELEDQEERLERELLKFLEGGFLVCRGGYYPPA